MTSRPTRRRVLKGAAAAAGFTAAAPYFFTRAHAQSDPKVVRFYTQDGSLGDQAPPFFDSCRSAICTWSTGTSPSSRCTT